MFKALGQQLRQPSGFFGKIVSKMMLARNWQFYERTIQELDIQSGERIFEIGYGPGIGINYLAKNTVNCRIEGIDFSVLMYEQASKRNKEFIECGFVDLKYGDLLNFEPGSNTYDKIFCLNVIYFWSNLGVVFRKIYTMLNKGGIYCIFMTHRDELEKVKFTAEFNKYTIENVVNELKAAGFESVEYKFDNGYYIKARRQK